MEIPTRSLNIKGWSPKNDEERTLIPPLPSPLGVFAFQASQPKDIGTRQSSPVASSPTSSNSSLSLEGGFQSDPYTEPVRRGDPAWVARPRNPFIIFRCEYSREHTKEGKRVRRPPGSQTEKTLSKRAAEAWHQLSAEEKNRFKELADQEKEEHARLHPNYRFRPMKRNVAKKKAVSVSRSNSQSLLSPLLLDSPVAAPMPRYAAQPATPEPMPPPPPPPPPVDMAAIKTGRRRSASVPSLHIGQYPFIPGQWVAQSPRLEMKRSRSVMANRPPPRTASTHYEGPAFDPRQFENSSGYHTPEESFGTVQSVSRGAYSFIDQYPTPASPVALSPLSHSLGMWAGETARTDSSPWASSPAAEPWAPAPAAELEGLSLQSPPYEYSSVQNDVVTLNSFAHYPATEAWASGQYPLMDNPNGMEDPGLLFSTANTYDTRNDSPYNFPLQQDLHYGQPMEPRDVERPEDTLFALDMRDILDAQQFQ
ncbi:hypothetical protein D9615_002015 [Tricholomella constricta]|uniref:HMG box domain-containing protein n=1 Tax=Tricholomella constricta TaxID=117010 RepID=A0A8H5HNR4_9AGAR|nr:hypothetical protein D9615_002015 [Tricholomella constricta]